MTPTITSPVSGTYPLHSTQDFVVTCNPGESIYFYSSSTIHYWDGYQIAHDSAVPASDSAICTGTNHWNIDLNLPTQYILPCGHDGCSDGTLYTTPIENLYLGVASEIGSAMPFIMIGLLGLAGLGVVARLIVKMLKRAT